MQPQKENMEIINEDIVIVGAGLAGLATSLALHRYINYIKGQSYNRKYFRDFILCDVFFFSSVNNVLR